jgi:hypothetical protein
MTTHTIGQADCITVTDESDCTAQKKWQRDRRFFAGMAIASAVAVFVGFLATYYLKAWWGTPVLPPLVHLHGILFTGWILLLIAQTSLVAARRTDLHRRIGVGGGVLAGLIRTVTCSLH